MTKLKDSLLSNTTLAWFTPLLEHQSPLLNNFESFFEKFGAFFGDSNKECIQGPVVDAAFS
jgi:hypothetical protein